MNRTKVIKAIGLHNARKAGKLPPHNVSDDSEIDYMAHAIEALVEIASEKNTEMLECIVKLNIDSLRGNISLVQFDKLLLLLKSIQIPKEVAYAYPVTMKKHFEHYVFEWQKINAKPFALQVNGFFEDSFGCGWHKFAAKLRAGEQP